MTTSAHNSCLHKCTYLYTQRHLKLQLLNLCRAQGNSRSFPNDRNLTQTIQANREDNPSLVQATLFLDQLDNLHIIRKEIKQKESLKNKLTINRSLHEQFTLKWNSFLFIYFKILSYNLLLKSNIISEM